MRTEIFDDETLEDLQCNGLKLIQKQNGFRFGTDAVLLADFAKNIISKKTLDFCTGTGVVPILMSAKTKTPQFFALEIQSDIADMAKRSVILNGLSERIGIECADLKSPPYAPSSFDLITCNPPYMKSGAAILNEADGKTISRHEVMCTLEDVIKSAARLLKFGGHFVMVHRPNRLADVLSEMRNFGIEPKKLRFVHASIEKAPILFLVDGMNKANKDMKILPPLILYNKDGSESDELKSIYGRN